MAASSMRNENVAVHPIDNYAIRETNIRLGTTATLVDEAPVEAGYWATEFGRPAGAPLVLAAPARQPSWHGELYQWHQNSVLNARTFFQVGPVRPSRRNYYGGRFTGNLGPRANLTATGSQRKIRGMVNGNVLVPLASERTPRAADPAVRELVARFLAAYPAELPNRRDFDERALNTNSPQRIDETDASLRLDADAPAGKLSLFYSQLRRRIDAFQFIAGQNPDSELHGHRAEISYRGALSPATDLAGGVLFLRTRSVLQPEPNAVGTRVRVGFQIEELGPDNQFPIDRAQNSWRGGALFTHRAGGGRHTLSFGGDLTRLQLNGSESGIQRGYFSFSNNFGRTAIENLLAGTPTFFEITLGEPSRGYRHSTANLFFADRWKPHSRIQLYWGLRYGLQTAPVEVHRLERFPYGCDCNNFSPRLALGVQLGAGWMMRASYGVSFGEIQPVTYQQMRNNLPNIYYIQRADPDLVRPLAGIRLDDPNLRTAPVLFSPDLVSPYSHQYTFSLERGFAGYLLRAGYLGSRSLKLMNAFIQNRAEPTPGIPLTTSTVNQRRPDPRFYEVRQTLNAGIGYFDAAQASLEIPLTHGLRGSVSYTFSKAIDEGSDFSTTAANRDLIYARSQWQYDSFGDKRGLSLFDATHSLLLSASWDLPPATRGNGWRARLLNDWQIAAITMVKSGTPLTLFVGSDSPGFGNVDGGPADRPHIVDPSILGRSIPHPDVSASILRRDRFAFIRPGELRGSLGRNTFRKAGISNLNASVTKQWHWGGQREWTVQFRGEAYNLTNTPQFDEPQRNFSAPSFGKITNALNDGRVFQLALRLSL